MLDGPVGGTAALLTMPIMTMAHQGGWDEALFVAVPIIVFAALLAVANRR